MDIRSLDLNLLKVLDALLAEGSTTRAGKRIGLSQPAVSAALARLRTSLRDPLFIRSGRGLESTDYARTLAEPLRATLDGLGEILAGPAVFDPATATSRFMLSGSDFFAEMLMPQLAERMQGAAPGMQVQLIELVPQDYIATLERDEVDLALVPLQDFPDRIGHAPLFHSSFKVIARRGHPALADLAPGGQMAMDPFCSLGQVLFSPEGKLSAMGDRALAAVGRQRRVVMTVPSFAAVHRAVAGSDLIALVPEQHAAEVAPRMGLTLYDPPMRIDPALIVMAWHRRATRTPAHRWLRRVISDILMPLNEGQAPLPAAREEGNP